MISFNDYVNTYGYGRTIINEKCYITVSVVDKDVVYTTDNSYYWHRLDGPAYIDFDTNGNIYLKDWYINDYYVTDEITQWAKDNDIDLDNLSEDDKLLIKIVWADYSGIIK